VRLLVTRPEADAVRSAAVLRAEGHEVVLAPLLRIEPIVADLGPGPWSAVLITSANAVAGLAERTIDLAGLPVIAVGDRSAAAARAAGFGDVLSAAGAMGELVALVRQRLAAPQRLLHLAGADRAGDLAATLAAAGMTVETRVVYRAAVVATLPDAVAAELVAGRIDGVMHYSRRTAEAFLAAAAGLGEIAPAHFCLSARVAEPLAAAGARRLHIAARPDERSLLELIDSR
jgi:uroporphyrinogen-III synthase